MCKVAADHGLCEVNVSSGLLCSVEIKLLAKTRLFISSSLFVTVLVCQSDVYQMNWFRSNTGLLKDVDVWGGRNRTSM